MSTILISPYFMTEVYGVFSKRVLPSSHGGYPRVMTTAYNVGSVYVYESPLTNNLKRGNTYLQLERIFHLQFFIFINS